MRVVFLALAFPNMEKSKHLYGKLVTQLHNNGHNVIVVAPAYDEKVTGLQIEAGVSFIRVSTLKLFKVGFIQKGVANLLLPYQYKKAIKEHNLDLNFDLIITQTPTVNLYNAVAWLKKKSGAKVYLILRDIFPQNAVDLGIMRKNSIIHSYYRRIEKKLYQISNSIGCMSEGNISYVKKHNPRIDHRKLHLLANWGDLIPLQSKEENLKLKSKEGLLDKFIVIFGGNIGLPQKMENIVKLAIACADNNNILFLIIGNGSELGNLKKSLAVNKVTNVQLRNGMVYTEYFKYLQIADVGLISLSENFTIPNIPSKTLSYYNAKKPILASIDVNTDFGDLLDKMNLGLWAEAGKTKELKEKLMLLYNNKKLRKEMGENGYQYMKEHLSSRKAYQIVIDQVNKT